MCVKSLKGLMGLVLMGRDLDTFCILRFTRVFCLQSEEFLCRET